MGRSYRITTLGCRVNRADSVSMERRLADVGYAKAPPNVTPDVWVVNTCAVTAEAMKKSRKAVRRFAKSGAEVIVTGCAAELEPLIFKGTSGVRAVLPNREKPELVSMVSVTGRAANRPVPWRCDGLIRVPLKVQDGCGRFCSYCIVPFLRGEPRSREILDVIEDVHLLRDAGAGEVVLCGIDLGSYLDPVTGASFEDLVDSVIGNAGDMWIRLSSIELSDVSDRLLRLMAEESPLRKYLHVPLQSGDSDVISDMGRHYSPEWFRGRVSEIREAVPGVGISTDVMVGFPTESEEAFQGTRSLLRDICLSRTHVFKYSPRPMTAAFSLEDRVSSLEKNQRAVELKRVADECAARFRRDMVGRIILVLVEGVMESEPCSVFGRAENFAGMVIKGNRGLIGKKIRVRVTGSGPQWLRGEPV